MLVPDRLQHLVVGAEAGLAAALAAELELLEQDLAELLRRADHELLVRELPDLALELRRPRRGCGWRPSRAARVSSLMPASRSRAGPCTSGSSTCVQQLLQAALLDQRALALRQLVDEHGAGGELVAGLGGDPAFLGELLERVAAAGRVEQVGGDRGVEDEVGRDLGERLGVVGDHRAVADGRDDVGRVVDLAGERDVAARVGREAPLRLARDQLALGDLGRQRARATRYSPFRRVMSHGMRARGRS